MKIILASKSPRRKEILKNAGFDFEIVASDFELDINGKEYNDDLLLKCVIGKAKNVLDKLQEKNYILIAADTVVVIDGKIIGKPKDRDDAAKILKKLSGKTHFVATGISMVVNIDGKYKERSGIEKTFVTFRELTNTDINNYLDKSKPFDKAGAYGIQDEGFDFTEKVEGNIDNVIGFPMTLFNHLWKPRITPLFSVFPL